MSHAEQRVRTVLAEIDEHPYRDLMIPHGFTVERVLAKEVPNMNAPDLFSEQRITVDLKMPVIYSSALRPRGLRACLPADRESLDVLRAEIESRVRVCGLRGRVREWEVTPDEIPPPYLPDGTPNGPPAEWSVKAVIEAH